MSYAAGPTQLLDLNPPHKALFATQENSV